MSTRNTSSQSSSGSAYKYAVKSRKPAPKYVASSSISNEDKSAPARSISSAYPPRGPRFDKAGDRREKEKILANFATKYSLPTGAFISETHRDLAKIQVPYDSVDPRAASWRGAVIDYAKGFLVKPGARTQIVRVGDDVGALDEFLATLDLSPNDKLEYVPFLGGAFVSVFKYGGQVYFSTGRSLGVSTSTHPGSINVRETLLAALGDRYNDLFEEDVPTYQTSYDFVLLTPGTLDVTKADLALPSVILVGTSTLTADVHGSPRTANIPIGQILDANTYYPTQPDLYFRSESLTEENAKKWLSGGVTGAPEELLVTRTDVNGTVHNYRLQSEASYQRHLVRGDVADVTTRLVQLLSDYNFSYDATTGMDTLISLDGREEVIHLHVPHLLSDLQTIAAEMKLALPVSREKEVDAAVKRVHQLADRLTKYFAGNSRNPNHPADEYYTEFHKYNRETREQKVWTIPQDVLFSTLRWYKLV